MRKILANIFIPLLITAIFSLPVKGQMADTVLLNNWYDSMQATMDERPDESLLWAQKGIAYSLEKENYLWAGYFYQTGGILHDIANRLDSCLEYFEGAIQSAKKIKDTAMEANALGNIAVAYQLRGFLEPALNYNFAAARLREDLPNKSYLSRSYNNIGLLYRVKKDYPKSLNYLNKSLQIKKQIADSLGWAASLLNVSSCYQHLKNYDSALLYSTESYKMATLIKRDQIVAAALGNMGIAYLGKNDLANANVYLHRAVGMIDKVQEDEELFALFEGLASYYERINNTDKQIYWLQKGLQKATELQRREQIIVFSQKMALYYEKLGDYKKAYQLLNASREVNDSLLNIANSRQLNEMTILYETNQKETKIQQLTNQALNDKINYLEQTRQKNILWVSLSFLIITAMAIGWALWQNKKKGNLLQKQNSIIESQLKEKEVLMQEIHHRVKNNLQIISGLLNLQSRFIKDPNAKQAVREGRNRVKSIALIHQQLYQQDTLTVINFKQYLSDVLDSIQQSFKEEGKLILHELICPEVNVDVEVGVPIGLIINELVTNSYKHAFIDKKDGVIKIEVLHNDPSLKIFISDNGVGVCKDFDWKTQKGFGIKMMETLVNKLKASFNMHGENGTTCSLDIPNYKNIV